MTAILLDGRRLAAARAENYPSAWKVWAIFAFAVAGPLVVTNVLWFTAIDRVGPSRASLFANLQFFLAAIFGVILLSETITPLQVAGGATIGAAILLSRFQRGTRAAAGRMSFAVAPRPHAAGLPLLDRPRARDLPRA